MFDFLRRDTRRALLVAVPLGLLGVALVPGEAFARVTLYAAGGTNSGNGLRITFDQKTVTQIFRSNARQFYAPVGLNLAIGNVTYSTNHRRHPGRPVRDLHVGQSPVRSVLLGQLLAAVRADPERR